MPRFFAAIVPPADISSSLQWLGGGIPGARWEPVEKLHLTLRFFGEIEGRTLKDVRAALARVDFDSFPLTLSGVGTFPPKGPPRSLWVGVRSPSGLEKLRHGIDRALRELPLELDSRKFAPHLTLARLQNAPEKRVAGFVFDHALYQSRTFEVGAFELWSSVLGPRGSKYRCERIYRLASSVTLPDDDVGDT